MMRNARRLTIGLVVCALGSFAGQQAEACMCLFFPERGFVIAKPETTLPANARGLLWAGTGLELKDVTVHRVTPQGYLIPERFTLEPAGPNLILVGLSDRPRPGQRYRFSTAAIPSRVEDPINFEFTVGGPDAFGTAEEDDPMGRADRQTVDVVISDQRLVLERGQAELTSGPRQIGPFSEPQGCLDWRSSTVGSAAVRLELPPAIEAFRDHLLYETFVNGERWSPRAAHCEQPIPGRSWRGVGEDLVYRPCSGTSAASVSATMRISAPSVPGFEPITVAAAPLDLACP